MMKRFFGVLFCVFALWANPLSGAEKRLGIVYRIDQRLVFRDLATKETFYLSGAYDPMKNGPWGISRDGTSVYYKKENGDGQIYRWQPLSIQEYALRHDLAGDKKALHVPKECADLAGAMSFEVGPDGSTFCAINPVQRAREEYIFVDRTQRPDRYADWDALNSQLNLDARRGYDLHPLYEIQRPSSPFQGVNVVWMTSTGTFERRFRAGNSAEVPFPKHVPFKLFAKDWQAGAEDDLKGWFEVFPNVLHQPVKETITNLLIAPAMAFDPVSACERESYQRDGYFVAYRDPMTLAIIYKTAKGWGPIEIRNLRKWKETGITAKPFTYLSSSEIAGPGIHEIPLQVSTCRGLAWMPDGSLSLVTDDMLWKFSYREINEGMPKAWIARNQGIDRGTVWYHPADFVMNIQPKEVTHISKSTKLYWIKGDTFVFRGENSNLYKGGPGKAEEQWLENIPETFFLCEVDAEKLLNPLASTGLALNSFPSESKPRQKKFDVGMVHDLSWWYANANSASLEISERVHESTSFYIMKTGSLKDVGDPLSWKKLPFEEYKKSTKKKLHNLPFGTIVLLKHQAFGGTYYAAIQLVAMKKDEDISYEYRPQFWERSGTYLIPKVASR